MSDADWLEIKEEKPQKPWLPVNQNSPANPAEIKKKLDLKTGKTTPDGNNVDLIQSTTGRCTQQECSKQCHFMKIVNEVQVAESSSSDSKFFLREVTSNRQEW